MDKVKATEIEERRAYFRIEDELNLFYKKIDAKSAAEPHHLSDNILHSCSLSSALEAISQESTEILHRLDKVLPDLAEYLRLIDTKIDLLAQAIMMQGFRIDESETRHVNLSASGIGFNCEEAFKPGDYLEIKMLLLSSVAVIVTYGRVVHCRHNPDNESRQPYTIGVEFIDMQDDDKEILVQYVVKKQIQQIRDKKRDKNS